MLLNLVLNSLLLKLFLAFVLVVLDEKRYDRNDEEHNWKNPREISKSCEECVVCFSSGWV